MRRRVSLLGALCSVVALGLPAAAAARTKVVYAGGPAEWQHTLERSGAGVNNFLINRVTINAGDTVDWNGASLAAGFHDVDIPKLNGEDLALITATGKTVQGVKDAAGNPFWFNMKVPELAFNTALFGPSGPSSYNGTTRIDSGLALGPKPHDFKVRFLTPGVYKYFCDVHYGMIGYVIVKRKGTPVPTAAQDARTLRRAEARYLREARHAVPKPRHATVSVGASAPGGLELFAMFPSVLRVKPGTVVRFVMSRDTRETHTATFGPKKYLRALAKAFTGPVFPPEDVYPSSPPGHIVLTPASHGNGFANTGVLDRDASTPLPAASTITFSKPGVYHYICLIHPFMRGTVIVK